MLLCAQTIFSFSSRATASAVSYRRSSSAVVQAQAGSLRSTGRCSSMISSTRRLRAMATLRFEDFLKLLQAKTRDSVSCVATEGSGIEEKRD